VKTNTIFLTFGDGSADIKAAASRLTSQAADLGIFTKIVQLDSNTLATNSSEYRNFLPELPKLFDGPEHFRATKPFILNAALFGKFGNFDQIIYADSGCEIISNMFSRLRLRRTLQTAQHLQIGLAQEIPYLEKNFTKKKTMQYLDPTSSLENTYQLQSTVILLNNNDAAKKFTSEWMKLSHPDLELWQDSKIPELELIGHRHDQSIFSILWKRNRYSVRKFYWDGARDRNKVIDFLTSSYAIQAIRNRNGATSISKLISTNIVFVLLGFVIVSVHDLVKNLLNRLKIK
jgi:hypothetical protein